MAAALIFASIPEPSSAFSENVQHWAREFPKTDFTKRTVDLAGIRADGAKRDTIMPIHKPKFERVDKVQGLGDLEPVLSFSLHFEARAYPLRVLLWHEIVNDTIAEQPIVVTYCPLCNSGVVFERRVSGKTVVFGNTGRLRHFDMVMYDRDTESWWQQFTGEAIIGTLSGKRLKALPSRVESFARFRERHPSGRVLVPNDPTARPYGTTPYVRMDTSKGEGLGLYRLPKGVKPFDRVVVVGKEAWTLKSLKRKGEIDRKNLTIWWEPGQNSIHDTKWIHFGRDVGNVIARRYNASLDKWVDTVYDITFAFAFKAFVPGGTLHRK
ncbi:MAG: DUF3179 domain-containing protein [Rhodospirillaceae bacterium]|jgi:hypothetical protein|nr:DUF3179 domain-containing protein [Rhodospirillaceae bacterium]